MELGTWDPEAILREGGGAQTPLTVIKEHIILKQKINLNQNSPKNALFFVKSYKNWTPNFLF